MPIGQQPIGIVLSIRYSLYINTEVYDMYCPGNCSKLDQKHHKCMACNKKLAYMRRKGTSLSYTIHECDSECDTKARMAAEQSMNVR